ncbi:MAG: PIG-L deacetylase family protein [Acidimicrobiia bacterium]|nr:PIG-L deacetylase family protein [Acidimicrobiia bacterium]
MGPNEPGQPPLRVNPERFTHELPTPASALAVGAHPDDVEFGAGGLLAKWAADGCTVHHLICTDGSKGTWDPAADLTALREARELEQRAAARHLAGDAAGEVRFLRLVDGELGSDLTARALVCEVIRELRPAVVLGHDPWKRDRLHPDHRHAGLLVCEGVVAARDPHFFADQPFEAHRPELLMLFEADEPDHVEDVSGFVPAKLAALEAHTSQFESTMKATDDAELEAFRSRIRNRLAESGSPFGLGAAEVFKLIRDL